jgi:hypothetical protein
VKDFLISTALFMFFTFFAPISLIWLIWRARLTDVEKKPITDAEATAFELITNVQVIAAVTIYFFITLPDSIL